MAERRKDNKGRVLKEGEGQRKDGMYYFRYIDYFGKRKTIYHSDLKGLRSKEEEIKNILSDQQRYLAGNITVSELLDIYIERSKHLKRQTKESYGSAIDIIKKELFANMNITDVKVGTAKRFLQHIQSSRDLKVSSVYKYKIVLEGAFQVAYDDELINRNPFDFKLDFLTEDNAIPKEETIEKAFTDDEINRLLNFLSESNVYSKYYNEIVVLLDTGLRVSELCGLTIGDIDFKKKRIKIDHQLCKSQKGDLYIASTKSKASIRYVPMTDRVCECLKNVWNKTLGDRINNMIDGYSGFVFTTGYGTVYKRFNVGAHIDSVINGYNKTHKDQLPKSSPHKFRHTFCTKLVRSGLDLKSIQYIMGHKDISTTMNIYTHIMNEEAAQNFFEKTKIS